MSDTVTYIQKLKHPKWQECRLETFKRSGFRCSNCGSGDKQLHIHHGYYAKGKEPWEADPAHLHVYCSDCHRAAEKLKQELLSALGELNIKKMKVVDSFVKDLDAFCKKHELPTESFALTIRVNLT